MEQRHGQPFVLSSVEGRAKVVILVKFTPESRWFDKLTMSGMELVLAHDQPFVLSSVEGRA